MANAIRFGRAGTNSGISRTTNLPDTSAASAALTMMCWIKYASFATAGGGCGAFSIGAGSGNYYVLFAHYSGSGSPGVLDLYNGAGDVTGSTLSLDRWYHLALTISGISGTNALVYLNGVLDISHTARSITTSAMWAGTDPDGDSSDAVIGAIKVWNRVLSPGEIAAEMPWAIAINRNGLNTETAIPSEWDVATSGVVIPKGTLTRWADLSGNGYQWAETGTLDTELGPPIQYAPSRFGRRARYLVAGAPPVVGVVQRRTLGHLGARVGSRRAA